jgi:glycosyltransferase involved in cell wall biosynthesis
MKLSIIVPVFNEVKTIGELIDKIDAVSLPVGVEKEVLVIDDGSYDGTSDVLMQHKLCEQLKVFHHKQRKGKTECIRTALKYARGDIVLIQDADLEYNPRDYTILLRPIIEENACVVYGSRWLGSRKNMAFINYLANRIMTATANFLFGASLSDVTTGYKVFRMDVIRQIPIKSTRFSFCGEVTGCLLKTGIYTYDVPLSYVARSRKEGKKIRWLDALFNYWEMLKYKFRKL